MSDLYNDMKEELEAQREKDKVYVIEESAKIMEKTVNTIVDGYAEELDAYIVYVKSILLKDEPTTQDLNKIIMSLPIYIYALGTQVESVALREGIAKEMVKTAYNTTLLSSTGTDTVKKSAAEEKAQADRLTNLAYTNAYRILRHKTDTAMELLNSAKKVLSSRIAEMSIERGDNS